MRKIHKAILPVAGLGTRFLPATKVIPKEMLPVVDKPLIQYALEEAVNADIKEFIFITRHNKGSIENYFHKAVELEKELSTSGKQHLLDSINILSLDNFSIKSIIQEKPLGLGHAVLCAKEAIGDEYFAVILPDDLINDGNRGCLRQMINVYEQRHNSIIAVENISPDDTDKYGIVSVDAMDRSTGRILNIVEKPRPEEAPSTLAVVGRYILSPQIFSFLEQTEKGAGGEIQLTDAISMLLNHEQVLAYEFEGKRYDCGSKLGYLQANVEYGLKDPELNKEFSDYLSKLTRN
jgi:UTP--glucose-1-phosphate uridylyltransferase